MKISTPFALSVAALIASILMPWSALAQSAPRFALEDDVDAIAIASPELEGALKDFMQAHQTEIDDQHSTARRPNRRLSEALGRALLAQRISFEGLPTVTAQPDGTAGIAFTSIDGNAVLYTFKRSGRNYVFDRLLMGATGFRCIALEVRTELQMDAVYDFVFPRMDNFDSLEGYTDLWSWMQKRSGQRCGMRGPVRMGLDIVRDRRSSSSHSVERSESPASAANVVTPANAAEAR